MATIAVLEQARAAARLLYDPVNALHTPEQPDQSLVSVRPRFLAIEGMMAATTVTVQIKIHQQADWHDYQRVDNSVPNAIIEFFHAPNYVRVIRSGDDDFKVFVQE